MITKKQYNDALLIISKYVEQLETEQKVVHIGFVPESNILEKNIRDLDISVRLYNVLKQYFYDKYDDELGLCHFSKKQATIADLSNISIYEFRRIRNAGRKMVHELKVLAGEYGIQLNG